MQIEGHLDWNDLSVSEERYLNQEYLMDELVEFFEKNREIWDLTDQDFARILGLNFEQFWDERRLEGKNNGFSLDDKILEKPET